MSRRTLAAIALWLYGCAWGAILPDRYSGLFVPLFGVATVVALVAIVRVDRELRIRLASIDCTEFVGDEFVVRLRDGDA